MKDPLLPPPKFQKAEFGGEKAGFSPPFSLFNNWEIQKGSRLH